MFKAITRDKDFYQEYFQEPGKAEKEFEADVRKTMLALLYSASGDPPPEKRWRPVFDKGMRVIDTLHLPDALPSWLTEQDLDFFSNELQESGFRGGLNWYRNLDRNWELTPFLDGAKVQQPTLYAAGDRDLVLEMMPEAYSTMESHVPNLRKKWLIPGAAHWIQQERPDVINALMLEFLKGL